MRSYLPLFGKIVFLKTGAKVVYQKQNYTSKCVKIEEIKRALPFGLALI